MNTYLFFLSLFVFEILLTIQGLDFNDEGFHAAIYQQIFNDPNAVQYGFWMWLTGIMGGLFMKIFPFLGLWGIRLEGVIISVATIAIVYNLLKEYLHKGYLRLSIVMLVLFINEDAKNFYYNNFSAFCYFLAAALIFSGLRDDKKLFLMSGGLVIGLNVFNRTPNILGFGLFTSILLYGFFLKTSLSKQLKQIGVFTAGFVAAFVLVFITMKLLGHFQIFVNSIKMVFGLSQEIKSGDGLEGAYKPSKLFTINLIEYIGTIRSAILVMIVAVISGSLGNLANQEKSKIRNIFRVINYLILTAILIAIFSGWFNHYRLVLLYTGLGIASGVLLFQSKADPLKRLLAFLGLFILFIHPFGSSEGISTVVIYSLWISFPITIDLISNIKKIDLQLAVSNEVQRYSAVVRLPEAQLKKTTIISCSLMILACLYNVIAFPYLCDRHSRLKMTYSVNNPHMRGIFTTKGRADAIDQLLEASSRYIKPGDVVLAFDCIPMYHYMTETKSYVRNPCIWFYTTALFKSELKYAESLKNPLPVVVRQKIKLTGDGSSWPEINAPQDYFQLKRNLKKNEYFDEFLSRNHYRETWSSAYFEILLPPK